MDTRRKIEVYPDSKVMKFRMYGEYYCEFIMAQKDITEGSDRSVDYANLKMG